MSLVIFRLDSSKILGSGHAQRCITLANYLRKRGAESIFICKNLDGHFGYLIERENYRIMYIPAQLSETEDAIETLRIINSLKSATTLIIDHYFLSFEFEQILRKSKIKIVVIDDLMNRYHDCDVLLDQNYKTNYDKCYSDLVPINCKKFLGPSYSLLRPQFYERQKYAQDIKNELKNIFVFFGGSDPTGETFKFLKAVSFDENLNYHILLSKGNLQLEQILSLENVNFHFHVEPKSITSTMEKCDFYVGSGGTITWERMCMKLSGIVISIADNQVPGARALNEDGLHFYLGTKEKVNYKHIPDLIHELEKNSLTKINQQIKIYKTLFSKKYTNDLINAIIS